MGVVYGISAHGMHLALTRGEQRCANDIGSVIPLYPLPPGTRQSKSDLGAVGQVFDRCVGSKSRTAMWRRLLHGTRLGTRCAVRRMAAAFTFIDLLTADRAQLDSLGKRAVTVCVSPRGD